jgi:hypothetical protein
MDFGLIGISFYQGVEKQSGCHCEERSDEAISRLTQEIGDCFAPFGRSQ